MRYEKDPKDEKPSPAKPDAEPTPLNTPTPPDDSAPGNIPTPGRSGDEDDDDDGG